MSGPPTPPSNKAGPSGLTPRKSHATHSESYRSNLGARRTAVLDDYPNIPYVTVDFFLAHVTPPLPSEKLDEVIELLKSTEAITGEGRIRGFDADPTKSEKSEVDQFKYLHVFSQSVLKEAGKVLDAKPSLVSRYAPHRTARSEKPNDSRADGYWLRVHPDKAASTAEDTKPRDGWEDVVLAQEFKLKSLPEDRYDNYRKILWNAQHILRNDPRREFTFGITIENTDCRFWFFARSHIMVSLEFNFITEPRPFVQFLVSLAFAHHLRQDDADIRRPLQSHGYDPSVERRDDTGQYAFVVNGKSYITCRVLSDFRAESICGRCTRVWEVYEETDKKQTKCVLKDVWVDRKNQTESEIWEKLSAAVDPQIFKEHFLTRLDSIRPDELRTTCSFMGLGHYTADESIDFFREHSEQTLDIPTLSPSEKPPKPSEFVYPNSTRSNISGTPDDRGVHLMCLPNRPKYIPRKHDRSVWKEVCLTFDQLDSMPLMVETLEHVVKALEAMYISTDAIHRDLSTGNVFYDTNNKTGRLGDLEFVVICTEKAWASQDIQTRGVKTGTLEFMAGEVYAGRYRFWNVNLASIGALVQSDPNAVLEVPTFCHNALHDLESIWWLLLWCLLRFRPVSPSHNKNSLESQLASYRTLFPGTDGPRGEALTSPIFNFFHPSFQNMSILYQVSSLQEFLRGYYTQVETSFPIPLKAFRPAFPAVIGHLQALRKVLDGQQIDKVVTVMSLLNPPKRKASAGELPPAKRLDQSPSISEST